MQKQELRAIIVKNNMTQKDVAEQLGITPKTFYRKMKTGNFGTKEVKEMITLLNIKNPIEIFLSEK